MQPRILITGASGWIGSTLVSHLVNSGQTTPSDILLAGSVDRRISIDGLEYEIHKLSRVVEMHYSLETIYHFAAVTKDRLNDLGEERFREMSREITFALKLIMNRSDVKTVVLASSGAAEQVARGRKKSNEDPYGDEKLREEHEFAKSCEGVRHLQIYRIWSLTGKLINKYASYAVTDFYRQAILNNEIRVNATRPTWRRYASSEQLVSLMANRARQNITSLVDIGGELIEMRSLAHQIAALVSPACSVYDQVDESQDHDDYYSRSLEFENLLLAQGVTPMTLGQQLHEMFKYIRV